MKPSTIQNSPRRSIKGPFRRVAWWCTCLAVIGGCVEDVPPPKETTIEGYKPPESIQGFLPNLTKAADGKPFRLSGTRLRSWVIRFPTGLQLSRSEERETTERRLIKILTETPPDLDPTASKFLAGMRKEFQKVEFIFAGEAPIVHPSIVDHQVVDANGKPVVRIFTTLESIGRTKISWHRHISNVTEYMVRTWIQTDKGIRLTTQYGTSEQSSKIQMAEAVIEVVDNGPLATPYKKLAPQWRGMRLLVGNDTDYIPNGAHTAENLLGHLQELSACYPMMSGRFAPIIFDSLQVVPGTPTTNGHVFRFNGRELKVKQADLPPFLDRVGQQLIRQPASANFPQINGYDEAIIIAPGPLTQSRTSTDELEKFGKAIAFPDFMERMRERQRSRARQGGAASATPRRERGGGR